MSGSLAHVLDASALLAYLLREAGSGHVREALPRGAAISAVNWAEVLSKLSDVGQRPEAAAQQLTEQGLLGEAILVFPLDEALAMEIARLRPLTRSAGLSLGDRACLALARRLGLPVLTADRTWSQLHLGVKMLPIR